MGPCVRRDDTAIVALPARNGRRMTSSFAGQTVEAARRALAASLKSAAIETADLDARLLTGHALGLDLTGLILAGEVEAERVTCQ